MFYVKDSHYQKLKKENAELKQGKADGNGTFRHRTGSEYQGTFRDGKYDGWGTCKWNGNPESSLSFVSSRMLPRT